MRQTSSHKTPSLAALGFVALCAALPLSGCGRSQAKTETRTVSTTTDAAGQPAAQPLAAAQPVGTAPRPAGDPCPSIGTIAETRGGPFTLNGARMIRLNSVCSATQMTEHLRSFGQGSRYLLVADDLRAGVQPGSLFEVSFGPPSTGEAAVLGTLNFFAARRPGGPGQPHSISYDVTRQVQAMAVAGWPSQGLGIAIAPSGEVAPGSDASVGAIRLVAQAPR